MEVTPVLFEEEIERLKKLLKDHGLPYYTGEGETKSLQDLAYETLYDGVIIRRRRSTGRLAAYRDRVFTLAQFTDDDGQVYTVQEMYRIFRDSTFVSRVFSTPEELARGFEEPSFSETRCLGLTLEEAVEQGLRQELLIPKPARKRITISGRVRRRTRLLRSYPGLEGVERCYDARYDLIASECKKIWVERALDKVCTICGWRDEHIPPHVRDQPIPLHLRSGVPKPKPQTLLVIH